jgi:two-component system KDP operon response regulator KdpE
VKVLVVDDSSEIVEVVSLCFKMRWSGTQVVSAGDGQSGIDMVEAENPDVVILDVGLPDMDGFEALREIRRFSQVPVIMLTVRGEDVDIARGLELGADDYMTKPFSHVELMARVQAVLRRVQGRVVAGDEQEPFSGGKLWVDFSNGEVKVSGKPVKLTATEYKLLYQLIKNEGMITAIPGTCSGYISSTSGRSWRIMLRLRLSLPPSMAWAISSYAQSKNLRKSRKRQVLPSHPKG